ncbi:dihydrofolate reductase family protein [Microbacterium laevaniformans]|uniref:dihydrofolate reductase family protein n=1 Tax=Microbacterium laevaniformans TaxID=36807 RepID=UPI0019586E57|nr:dihydrofolate reductase family protein [Microbacterium laevaniformans]MBM7753930.1 dihydrofolate reductase [Microbacterium laevaniformans]GLJ63144.1 deaminase [Microbacterium laevaniformans]
MGLIVFSMSHSLDGYITDAEGRFDWGAPDEHIFRAALEEVRGLSAHFLGRRLYETMRYWEDPDVEPTFESLEREFAEVWKALPKIVVSSTLDAAPGQNTRLLQGDLVEEIARLRDDDEVGEIAIGGATLAAAVAAAGLVDEYRSVVYPILLGGGTPFYPPGVGPTSLGLVSSHRWARGIQALPYRVVRPPR